MICNALAAIRGCLFAHRGWWDETAPENSLAAFRRAADAGFGIELDVRRTRDGALVVMHDASLLRMCGVNRTVEESSLADLRPLRLAGSEERIPTLVEALGTIGGRAPVIVEIKKCRQMERVCAAVTEQLRGYPGAYAVESFHPLAVRWMRRHVPSIPCGLLVHGGKARRAAYLRFSLLARGLVRPDFVACEAGVLPAAALARLRGRCGCLALWTIRSQAEMDANVPLCDLQIFEGFIPKR